MKKRRNSRRQLSLFHRTTRRKMRITMEKADLGAAAAQLEQTTRSKDSMRI
jgi:hypothetical protein